MNIESIHPVRTPLSHARPSWIKDDAVFFITVCCRERGRNQLCNPVAARHLLDTIQFRQEQRKWHVQLFVVMPDHVHALVSFATEVVMKKVVCEWKQSAARRIGILWQRDFFDHRLRSDDAQVEKAHYIRMNPVRKGLAQRPEDWPYTWPRHAALP
jgi:REP element-mobilizing transposase RayT